MHVSDAPDSRGFSLPQTDTFISIIVCQADKRGRSSFAISYGHQSRGSTIPRGQAIQVIASETCLNVPDDLKTFTEGENGLHVRFTTKMPLPNHDSHPPIDVVVLVYKVFSKDSLKTIKEIIPYIDVRYLVGKCFILVTSDVEFSLADVHEIETFASVYQLPIHYASKVKSPDGNGPARLQLPSSLMSIYCPPIGSDVNSFIIHAAMMRGSCLLTDLPTAQ